MLKNYIKGIEKNTSTEEKRMSVKEENQLLRTMNHHTSPKGF